MKFEYSCFISYRHGYKLTQTFVRELKEALTVYIDPYLDQEVFIDESRLSPGKFIEPNLADALCKSVCMILVFVPKYFKSDHLYCAREYLAMKTIEEKRFEAAGIPPNQRKRSFIIPVILTGPERIPPVLAQEGRVYCDFSQFSLADTHIEDNQWRVDEIRKIAQHIYELYLEFEQLDIEIDCERFTLPSNNEAQIFLNEITIADQPFPR